MVFSNFQGSWDSYRSGICDILPIGCNLYNQILTHSIKIIDIDELNVEGALMQTWALLKWHQIINVDIDIDKDV